VCEGLYRSVEHLLHTTEQINSQKRRKYGIQSELQPEWFSLLTCGSKLTKVQREHLDDEHPGVAAIWGLYEGQYVIVWLGSYEMNLELEFIYKFYEFVVSKKPAGWTNAAFWNLVAGIHLESKGFNDAKRPTPVKIPLEVGQLLLMDMLTIHAGMPFTEKKNLRGYLYWAKVAGRNGDLSQAHTTFLWTTDHPFYPAWRFICEDRAKFEVDD